MSEAGRIPEWDRGPKCPLEGCGGPAVPIDEHHRLKTIEPGKKGRPTSHRIACAWCGKTWRGTNTEDAAAWHAHWAWEAGHYEKGRSLHEERTRAAEKAKADRLLQGRW